MSKKYFEWSHQLRHVHDGSTMGTRQKKYLKNDTTQHACTEVVIQTYAYTYS